MRKICFVLDRSGSMEGEPLEAAKEGIHSILQDFYVYKDHDEVGHNDHISFITFDDVVKVRVPLQPLATGLPKANEALSQTSPGNLTALWDACGEAMRQLSGGDPDAEPWAIILTDGRDTSSRRFNERNLIAYGDKMRIEPRLIFIGIGSSVEENKLQRLTGHFHGQYIAAGSDRDSIRGAFLQATKSLFMRGKLTPRVVIDVKKGQFGDLKIEEFTKDGMGPPEGVKEREKSIDTDIAKMPCTLLKRNTPDAEARKFKAVNEKTDYEISVVGDFDGALVFRVLQTSLNKTYYSKLKLHDSDSVYGACTCADFINRAAPLGVPCKHIWIALGVGDEEKKALKGEYRERRTSTVIEMDKKLSAIEDYLEMTLITIIKKKFRPIIHNLLKDTFRKALGQEARIPIDPTNGRYFIEGILNHVKNSHEGLTKTQICGKMGIHTSGGMKKLEIALRFLEKKELMIKRGKTWFGVYR